MVRRPITVRKPKTIRVSKSEQYLVNKKYLGDEPSFIEPLTKIDYINALNWYNYMNTTEDARNYLIEFLEKNNRKGDIRIVKNIPDTFIPTTLCWTARMYTKGFIIPEDNNFNDKLETILTTFADKNHIKNEEEPEQKVNVQNRIKERFHDIMGEIEGLIDDNLEVNEEFSFYHWLQENNIPPVYISKIIQKISPVCKELMDAYKGQDEQLKEGYRHLTKPQLRKQIEFFNGLIVDADTYANNTKKIRKPRKPRTVSMEKKLKNFKFQKEDTTFKIASVDPAKIIGSQELWTFNTKYKTITVLKAKDRGGLQIKGTSILNYDEMASATKGTGRRTEYYLSRVKEGGKVVLRKLVEELKTDKTLATRSNENTILLRVIQ